MPTPSSRPSRSSRPRVQFEVRCRAVRFDRRRLRAVLERVLTDHGRERGTLSVAVVDDAAIHAVNREFLAHDEPTDVISFPLEEDLVSDASDAADRIFGELIVSAETARREAARRGLEPARELALYAIHGTLHLVGYDDHEPRERRRMRDRERRYLRLFDAES